MDWNHVAITTLQPANADLSVRKPPTVLNLNTEMEKLDTNGNPRILEIFS
jgi:hypothetical protein